MTLFIFSVSLIVVDSMSAFKWDKNNLLIKKNIGLNVDLKMIDNLIDCPPFVIRNS